MKRIAAVLLLASLAGCATPEAGRATSPVDARLIIEWPAIAVGTSMPTLTITATQTVTITPTSSASQTATASPEVDAEIPVNITPGSGTSVDLPK